MNKLIKKLQAAINLKFDEKLMLNQTQFYSDEQKRAITIISVKKAVETEEKKISNGKPKFNYIELFKSCSDTEILLFLRDYWFRLNGWEIPDDGKRGSNNETAVKS